MPKRHKRRPHKYAHRDVELPPKVKALLVGINYIGTANQLGGCINDVLDSRVNIIADYPDATITLMTDNTSVKPTRKNILNSLKDLIQNAKAGDILFFHFSGHGSQVVDLHGDEKDGWDETICPIDFETKILVEVDGSTYRVDSQIINDEIHDIISRTPKDVKFLMLSDSCHSGTIGDLEHNLAHSRSLIVGYDPITGKHRHLVDGKIRTLSITTETGDCGGELRIISGCEEAGTSADTGKNGACTKVFWETVKEFSGLSAFFGKVFSKNIEDLRLIQDSINSKLKHGGYEQYSVLSWEVANPNPHQHGQQTSSMPNYSSVSYLPSSVSPSHTLTNNHAVYYSYPQLSYMAQLASQPPHLYYYSPPLLERQGDYISFQYRPFPRV
jgi:hypothetical protein